MIDHLFLALGQHFTLTPEDKNFIETHVALQKFRTGEILLNEGEICNYGYFVVNGVVRMFRDNSDGDEVTSVFAREGNFLAKIDSLVNGKPSEETISGSTKGELFKVRREDYLMMFKVIPSFKFAMNKIANNFLLDTYNFNRALLEMDAQERYLAFLEKYPTIVYRVPLGQVASYLGINQSTLSRIRKKVLKSL